MAHRVIIVKTNHRLDPPIGTELAAFDFEPDVVVVGWDASAGEPSTDRRWPMLHEHVQPSEGQP